MKSELRHFCRHCRSKLKAPVANHRAAFCASGCHIGIDALSANATCPGTPKTSAPAIEQNARKHGVKRPSKAPVKDPLENPIKSGIKMPVATDRGVEWAIAVNSARIRARGVCSMPCSDYVHEGPGFGHRSVGSQGAHHRVRPQRYRTHHPQHQKAVIFGPPL